MQRSVLTYLKDIHDAAYPAWVFTLGVDFQMYCDLAEKRMAVERAVEIMGEAATQAAKLDPMFEVMLPDARKMMAMRNILIPITQQYTMRRYG